MAGSNNWRSIAVKNPDLFKRWIREYGEDKIILGADVKVNKIAVGGWLETSEHEIDPFIKSYLKKVLNMLYVLISAKMAC